MTADDIPDDARAAPAIHSSRVRKARREELNLAAAIDIGATSVRMRIAGFDAEEPGRPPITLENLIHPLAIGADTFRFGHIRPDTLRALGRVLTGFARLARDEYKVAELRCVGTSALREASNQEIVVDRLAHESGVRVRVIDAVEESRLAFQMLQPALERFFDDPKRHSLVLSLGGGVTDLMLLEGRDLAAASSRRLGTARLLYADRPDARAGADGAEALVRNIVTSALDLYSHFPVTQIVMNNGGMAHAVATHPESIPHPHGAVLEAEAARQLALDCQGLPAAALAERFHVRLGEAELLETAFVILRRILDVMPSCRWIFADLDTVSALLYDIAGERRGGNPRRAFARQTLRSAQAVGERYRFDRAHAERVTESATRLFECLAAFLDLAPDDLTLLQVACILHDIGMFVSEHAHHKHSAYLVRWSELAGLEDMERIVASQVVRYHRRAVPSPAHDDFMALMPKQRLRVRKLAALLRLADALDRTHQRHLRVVRATLGEREVLIEIAVRSGDVATARAAIADKGDLFEQVTGLRVVLRPVASE